MTIDKGDGVMARRLAHGMCPKCQTAIPKAPRIKCLGCGLEIVSNETQDEDRPVVVRMKAVWK